MIERIPFGPTGHESSRVLFGAAALGFMTQDRADQTLEGLRAAGINHIDTAAMYGDSELRVGAWLGPHREEFFLATKTRERSRAGARESIERSLERLQVDCIDLIQLHNLVDEAEWDQALGPDGALEALIAARDAGQVRFLGVTGHGVKVAEMHLRSLERFPFDSVLLPCNFSMLSQPDYAADFDALVALCAERNVAVQTIKALARRRWTEPTGRRFSWYEPLDDPEALRRAVHYVLARPGLFLNTSSDARLLPATIEAAEITAGQKAAVAPEPAALAADAARLGIEPLFVPDGPQNP